MQRYEIRNPLPIHTLTLLDAVERQLRGTKEIDYQLHLTGGEMTAVGIVVGCLKRAAELTATPYPPHQAVYGGVGLGAGEIHQRKLLFGIYSDSHVFCVFMSINNYLSMPPERQVDKAISRSRLTRIDLSMAAGIALQCRLVGLHCH